MRPPKFSGYDKGAFAFSFLVLIWLITQGTFNFARPERLSSTWDSLARHLVHLDASVDPATIDFEGTRRSGKTYVPNYGMFPALLRIPVIGITSMYDKWARVSCALAALIALLAFAWLVRRAIDGNRARFPIERRNLLSAASIVAFGLGTPLFFLMSCGRLYHETMLWSLSWSIVCLALCWEILWSNKLDRRVLTALFAATGLLLLSRVTFGLTFALVSGLIAWHAYRHKKVPLATLTWAALPFAAACLIQGWYNQQRYGSFLQFYNYVGYYTDPATYGGIYNWKRLPSLFWIYLGFTPRYFFTHFPFVKLARIEYFTPELFYSWREETIAFWLSACWLFFGAVLGAIGIWRAHTKKNWLPVACFAALTIQWWALFTHCLGTERYVAELMPLAIFAYAFALRSSSIRTLAKTILPLGVLSIAITCLTTTDWMIFTTVDTELQLRESWARFFYPTTGHPERRYTEHRFDGYDLIDTLDLGSEESKKAHALASQNQPTYDLTMYPPPQNSAVLIGNGQHIQSAQWKIRGVHADRDLAIVLRGDGQGTGVFTFEINGKRLAGELWLPQSDANYWEEKFYVLPAAALQDGENTVRLIRLAKSPSGGSSFYFFWFLQSKQAPAIPRSMAAAKTVVPGFAQIVAFKNRADTSRGNIFLAHVDDRSNRVDWESAPISSADDVQLDFDAYVTGAPGVAYLFLNDEWALRFPVDEKAAHLEASANGYRMVGERIGDSHAKYHLTIPAGRLPIGKPVKLTAQLLEGQIGTRFGVVDKPVW